jgi:hypothetical protein
MLAYLLAILVGTGSVGMYVAAFFVPEVHRQKDFIWSGVGCFYALMLWIYGEQMSGGMLVGQTAGVSLLCWFAWETLTLRRQIVPTNQRTPIPSPQELSQKIVNSSPSPVTQLIPKEPEPTVIESDNGEVEAWIKLEQIEQVTEKLPVEENL